MYVLCVYMYMCMYVRTHACIFTQEIFYFADLNLSRLQGELTSVLFDKLMFEGEKLLN